MSAHLFLFGVQLEALSKRAGLRLHVLLLHLTQALGIRDVFILGAFKQTEGSKETTKTLLCVVLFEQQLIEKMRKNECVVCLAQDKAIANADCTH